MKKLELNQMENLEGGLTTDCKKALFNVGLSLTGLLLSLSGGPFGIAIGVSAYIIAASDMTACHGQF